ncbi:uncharacterized protein LOC113457669 [Microtus ochrogaster]|uniref:Uncharacterized protein LOC113457669 n=1 Tax=Microtus ochrogaster TaxID=79684 RepID=A0ABM1UJW6_MICOH|nr:uncharacterized protein LOC113457669 [Microtus ochrogaster]
METFKWEKYQSEGQKETWFVLSGRLIIKMRCESEWGKLWLLKEFGGPKRKQECRNTLTYYVVHIMYMIYNLMCFIQQGSTSKTFYTIHKECYKLEAKYPQRPENDFRSPGSALSGGSSIPIKGGLNRRTIKKEANGTAILQTRAALGILTGPRPQGWHHHSTPTSVINEDAPRTFIQANLMKATPQLRFPLPNGFSLCQVDRTKPEYMCSILQQEYIGQYEVLE